MLQDNKHELYPGRHSLLAGSHWRHSSWQRLTWQTVTSLLYMPEFTRRLARSSFALRKLWNRIRVRNRMRLLALACRSRVQNRAKCCYLQDQGLIQAIAYLARDWPACRAEHLIVEFYEALGTEVLPNLLVSCCCDVAQSNSRTKMSGAKHQAPDQVIRTIKSLTLQRAVLHEHFGTRIVTIDNSGELQLSVAHAQNAIDEFFNCVRVNNGGDGRSSPLSHTT
jgi:hypothetical protein